ncbi:MAG: ATP-binding cassette domain-containing protein [Anaerolineae bacterium]|nr:ATP-binding cassette domain-containing protein [Anaerolineae bacterium]
MSDLAVRVRGLGKEYRIGDTQKAYRTLRDTLVDSVQAPARRAWQLARGHAYGATNLNKSIWALKDVSFDVRHGEVLGIIGSNGAGKSTLLKILSRITEPTEGAIDLYGRIGALLEVGTGFHPELTGRENVFLNGAILGMSRLEVARKFDEIVDFSGIETFIDTPVKHYSSGMRLRLGFSVAAHLEPEILVIDEVLAVGDVSFQRKCLGKMENVASSGRTVLFVSHNMTAVSALCTRAIMLKEGRIVEEGSADDVIQKYIMDTLETTGISLSERTDREGDGKLRFTTLQFQDANSKSDVVIPGNDVDVIVSYKSPLDTLHNVEMSVKFMDNYNNVIITGSTSFYDGFDTLPAEGNLICRFYDFPLAPGHYKIYLYARVNGILADQIENAGSCDVSEGDFFGTGKSPRSGGKQGAVMVRHHWYTTDNLSEAMTIVDNDYPIGH